MLSQAPYRTASYQFSIHGQWQFGLRVDLRRSIEQQRAHGRGVPQREVQRKPRALRHAQHRSTADASFAEHRGKVVDVAMDVRLSGGQAEAAPVEAQHREVNGKQRDEKFPALEVQRPAVQQDQRRT